jgi:hypothetical protein
MKRLIFLLFSLISFSAFSQSGSLSQSVYRSRVNDSTTVNGATAQGYGYFFWNNQKAVPSWQFWNGTSLVDWDPAAAGGGGGTWGSITGTLSDQTDLQNALNLKAPLASPTFTGTVTVPTPFTLGATSVTSTGTQLNYLNAATGTTGTTSTNIVFSTSPTLVTPNLGTPSAATLTNATGLPVTGIAPGSGSAFDQIRINAGNTAYERFTPTFNPMTSVGDLMQGGTSGVPERLASVGAGSFLRSGGVTTASAWSTLVLPNAATATYIPYATATNTWGESSLLTFSGTRLSPNYITLAAGTATAGTAPLVGTSGTLLTTIVSGAVEYNNAWYVSSSALNRTGVGGAIADFIADVQNSGTSETDIQTYTTKASTLAANGQKLTFDYTMTLNDNTATAQIKVLFAGTTIGDTGALTVSATGSVVIRGWIIRTGASTARASVTISSPTTSTALYTAETDITGLTFTNTNILKTTATAGGGGGGSSDITGKMGTIYWWPAAAN